MSIWWLIFFFFEKWEYWLLLSMCNPSKCTIYRLIYRFPMNFIWPRYQSISIKYSPPITIFKNKTNNNNNKNSSNSVIVKSTPLKWKDKSTVNKCLSFALDPSRWTHLISVRISCRVFVYSWLGFMLAGNTNKKRCKICVTPFILQSVDSVKRCFISNYRPLAGPPRVLQSVKFKYLLGIPLKYQQLTRHCLFPKWEKKAAGVT